MAALFRVKAIYEYSSPHEDDLNFDIGQVITVTDEDDDDWYGGEYVGADGSKREGIFPRNFVEKIEPTAPPRPTRARTKKDSESAPALEASPASPPAAKTETAPASLPPRDPEPEPEPEPEPKVEEPPRPAEPEPAPVPVQSKPVQQTSAQPAAPTAPPREPQSSSDLAASPKPKAKPGPPPVSEKPSSFKDRIAAFNKPAAPPVAPIKPGGLSLGRGGNGGGGFIKKPFVAPPPSRNAYVPPPTAAPTAKVYRRDEDPEIKQNETETQEQAGKAGLIPSESGEAAGEEDQPKPTSLKERIALLQQQQREQAERHANAAAKKPKPAKPVKKPEVAAATEDAAEGEDVASIEHVDSGARTSTDEPRSPRGPLPPRRKSSKGPAVEPVHDGNEADMSGAGDTTEGQDDEREDIDEPTRRLSKVISGQSGATIPLPRKQEEEGKLEEEKDEGVEEEEEEDEDVDPEVKRKEELRARMAKMSGGMGFHGMFGAPMAAPAPPKKKKSVKTPKDESGPTEDVAEESTSRPAPPVPTAMMLPGMGGPRKSSEASRHSHEEEEPEPTLRAAPPPIPVRQPEPVVEAEAEADEEEDEETPAPTPGPQDTRRDSYAPPPPIPGGRPAPPPVPAESRPPPPPPPGQNATPTEGSESDDELSGSARDKVPEASATGHQPPLMPPPPEPMSLPIRSPPLSPRLEDSPSSPLATASKRNSRPPPPIPGAAPPTGTSRPPPPPPPGNLSRQSTADANLTPTPTRPPQAGEENEKEGSEYEGDYDTDIASSVPHKDALKAHARDSSVEDVGLVSPTTDAPPSLPPPVPTATAPRAAPPPVPPSKASPETTRRSMDAPRAAPPPPPPGKEPIISPDQKVLDPYHYNNATGYAYKRPKIEEEEYFGDPQSPPERRVPPLAPSTRGRLSADIPRSSISGRRSVEVNRGDSSFIANDMELAVQSGWWKQANQIPPVLQGRKDICFESDESTTTNGGAKTVITREIFVLFQDYSQSILTARYDPYDPTDVELEQRHEAPPRPLRQDQMESFYERFGRHIGEAAASKKDSIVGDGTPYGFVQELLKPFPDALGPVGTRSYGALVYANMANASTQLHDVIRAGDILSIRNARFQGKHGPMHAKYSVEVGKPDHVAIVAEWDGTKKKVRAWEQGRESKKVKQESFKLDDLRSGEVKIWRVVPRSWVEWSTKSS